MSKKRFWWHQQNKAMRKECRNLPGCWLPSGHGGACQPSYNRGDYVKVEFTDEATGIGEWVWLRVDRSDDEKRLVFGTLDSEPLHDYGGQLRVGSELVVSFSQIREHRKPSEFTKQ
jgi:hypothetical protein